MDRGARLKFSDLTYIANINVKNLFSRKNVFFELNIRCNARAYMCVCACMRAFRRWKTKSHRIVIISTGIYVRAIFFLISVIDK